MKTLLFLTVAAALSGCAGSGANGSWTAADTESTVRALGSTYDTGSRIYRDYQSGYRTQPTVVVPPASVYPVTPIYP